MLKRKELVRNGTMVAFVLAAALLFIPQFEAYAQTAPSVQRLQNEVEQVYQKTHNAVANITTKALTVGMFNMPTTQKGAGSGFLYDDNGHVVTNYHVIKNAKTITVTLGKGRSYEAEIVGTDPLTDIAVLEIEGEGLPAPLELGNSEILNVGEFVVAMGNPFSFDQTLTFGVISALGRMIKSPNGSFISEAIQTDTPINPGNSGGPLMNLEGEVIGVNSAIISPSGASAGIGFAISSNIVKKVVPALIEEGHYPHPWLGIQSLNLNPGLSKILNRADVNVPVEKGVLIVQILNNSPADESGLRGGRREIRIGNMRLPVGGDIITGIEGQDVDRYKDLIAYLENEVRVGDSVELTLYRSGDKIRRTVEVGERPQSKKTRGRR